MSLIVPKLHFRPRQQLLLMTATITPNNAKGLQRADPVTRLADYYHALEFYLGMLGGPLSGIVFVENSSSDISMLEQLVRSRGLSDRVEFVCNYGSYVYTEEGRAYGELKLLEHAMLVSGKVLHPGAEVVVWKVTGRYKVRNLASIIATAPADFDVYVDMRDHPEPWLDTRLMAWTRLGFEQVFRGLADEMNARAHERVMREYIAARADNVRLVPRFRREPFIEGVRGYDNNEFSRGGELIKSYLRSVSRAVAPWCWI
jgi:hypothetical protein